MPDRGPVPDPRAGFREELTRRLARLRLRPERESEIVEELAQHLDALYAELRLTHEDDEACRLVLEELAEPSEAALGERGIAEPGRLAAALAAVESTRVAEPVALGSERSSMLATLGQDVRFALRSIVRHRGVAALV